MTWRCFLSQMMLMASRGSSLQVALLDDDDVLEVMVNAPDAIFVRRHRGAWGNHDEMFYDDEHVLRALTKILGSRDSGKSEADSRR